MITLGGIAIFLGLIRIFIFKIPESPKYLLSRGRDAEAVAAVNHIARFNRKPETLTLDLLQEIDNRIQGTSNAPQVTQTIDEMVAAAATPTAPAKLSFMEIMRENFKDFSLDSYRTLFAGRKMAQHSAVTFLIWLTIGVAYPLYFAFIPSYLETKASYSANTSFNYTYMVYCIVSSVGIIGPIAAGFLVETRFGRRWMMAISSVLTGAFLFAYTSVGTQAADIGFQCATAILGNFGKLFHHRHLMAVSNMLDRIRHHVCVYSRVLSGTCTRHWNRYCRYIASSGWSCGLVRFDLWRLHCRSHLRQRSSLDCGRILLHCASI